jgi:YD repeat-containing protein
MYVEDGAENPAKSPVVSRVFALTASADRPKGALLEEAVKVSNEGVYRRSRNAYVRGSSCVSSTGPTETLFVPSGGGEVVLSRVEYNCADAARWKEDENGQKTEFRYDDLGRVLKEVQPGDSEATPTTEYVYDDSGPGSTPWKPRRMEVKGI